MEGRPGFSRLGTPLETLGAKRAPSRVEVTDLGHDGFLIESGPTRVIVEFRTAAGTVHRARPRIMAP